MSLVTNISGGISSVIVPAANFEVSTPFQFTGSGRVATLSDPTQRAIQHLLALAMTAPSERVMRPTYGVGLRNMVFEESSVTSFTQAAGALQSAFAASESAIATVTVNVVQQNASTFAFQVEFTVNQDPVVHQAVFDYSGNLIGAS